MTPERCTHASREHGKCLAPATEETPAGRPLCSPHADEFWDNRYAVEERYPDSDVAPDWFDPTYAGETW